MNVQPNLKKWPLISALRYYFFLFSSTFIEHVINKIPNLNFKGKVGSLKKYFVSLTTLKFNFKF